MTALSGAGSPPPRAGAGWVRPSSMRPPAPAAGVRVTRPRRAPGAPGSALAFADFVMMGPGRKAVWVSLNFTIVPFPLLPKDSDTRRILLGGRRPAGGRVGCPGSQRPGPLTSSVQTFCHQRPGCVCKSLGRWLKMQEPRELPTGMQRPFPAVPASRTERPGAIGAGAAHRCSVSPERQGSHRLSGGMTAGPLLASSARWSARGRGSLGAAAPPPRGPGVLGASGGPPFCPASQPVPLTPRPASALGARTAALALPRRCRQWVWAEEGDSPTFSLGRESGGRRRAAWSLPFQCLC